MDVREKLSRDEQPTIDAVPVIRCRECSKWQMLICTCPNEMECPALLSDVVCFPWCEYLEDDEGDD